IEDCLLLTFCLTKKLQKVKAVPDSRPTTSLPAKQNKLASTMLRQNFVFNACFAVWVPRLSAKAVRLTHDKNNKSDILVVL
ncbi:MAG: hypothetical protein LBL79_03245, partial [Prevotella sp.]|nr:hypothetical protein [Prevotella sp.]